MNILNRFKSVSTFVFSIDGVLTDGALYTSGSGEFSSRMHTKDIHALSMAVTKGYQVLFISAGSGRFVSSYLGNLGIGIVFTEKLDKQQCLQQWLQQQRVAWINVL